MTLDDIRARLPHIGLALYALEPGLVTLEVHAPGDDGEPQVWTFTGRTEAAVLARAFPAPVEAPQPDALPAEPPASIFD